MTKAGIFGSQGSSEGSEKDPDVVALRSTNLFEKAVVIDTICDVSIRSDPPETLLESQKPAFVLAPRNSLVCRLLTTGNRLSETSDIVCFPFFSSHFVLPVKPGEQVWIFRQKALSESDRDQMYWISRVSDVLPVEDVNFSPFSRVYWITQSGSLPPDRVLGFPNGSEDQQLILGESDALQKLVASSVESKNFVMEPVPRLTKRPGDLVIQGSNNTAIVLGTDRGWDISSRPAKPEKSNAVSEETTTPSAGSIDVVTGRGRYFNPASDEIKRDRKKASAGVANSTQPFIASSVFGKFETDKDPGSTQDLNNDLVIDGEAPPKPGNPKTNPAEGDPDFLVDASRVYVSSNAEIDKRLGLDKIIPAGFEKKFEAQSGPTVAVKSDHVRIVARKVPLKSTDGTLPEKFESAAGSIRIVKEGNNDEDLATIIIESDGTIQISGTKIFLGRTKDDGGAGIGPGPGNSQPYMKYKEMEDLWKETMDTLSQFCDTVLTHVTPGYGAPSPQLNKAAADMKTKIASKLKKNIETVKSERIFGE